MIGALAKNTTYIAPRMVRVKWWVHSDGTPFPMGPGLDLASESKLLDKNGNQYESEIPDPRDEEHDDG